MRLTSIIGLAVATFTVVAAVAWTQLRGDVYELSFDGPRLRWSDPGQKSEDWIEPVRGISTAEGDEYWFQLPVPDDLAKKLNPWREYELDLRLMISSEKTGSTAPEPDWSAYSFFEFRDGSLSCTMHPHESWMRHGELLKWHYRGEQVSPTEYSQTYSFRFYGADNKGPELAARRVTIHLESDAEQ